MWGKISSLMVAYIYVAKLNIFQELYFICIPSVMFENSNNASY